jgi:hypothetical protein
MKNCTACEKNDGDPCVGGIHSCAHARQSAGLGLPKQAPLPPNGTRQLIFSPTIPGGHDWETIDNGDVFTLLANGWVVCDVHRDGIGTWWSSRPVQEIPSNVLGLLPTKIASAITTRLADGRKLVIR